MQDNNVYLFHNEEKIYVQNGSNHIGIDIEDCIVNSNLKT